MGDRYTRRRALQLGSAGLFAGLAGCGTLGGGDSGSGDGTNPLDSVPAGSVLVAHVEVGRLLDGSMVQQGVEQALSLMAGQSESYEGPKSYEDLLSMAESRFGLDPKGANTATVFFTGGGAGSSAPTPGPAAVVDAEWSEDDVVAAFRENTGPSLSERQYGDATLYAIESRDRAAGLGVLSDGRFVLGTVPLIERVVDTVAGEASPVGGTLATTYEATADGPVRFAVDITSLPGERSGPMASVETISGGMTVDGDRRTMTVTVEATDDTAASGVRALVENGLSRFQSQLDGAQDIPKRLRSAFEQLQQVEVSKDGSTVTITHEAPADEAGLFGTLLVAVAGSFVLGVGQSQATRAPQVSFQTEYDAEAGTVTITHEAGDTIQARNLYVIGSTGNGQINRSWTEYGVEGNVTVGTSVTVENVAPDYELRVVWQSAEGDVSAVLMSNQGPEA